MSDQVTVFHYKTGSANMMCEGEIGSVWVVKNGQHYKQLQKGLGRGKEV